MPSELDGERLDRAIAVLLEVSRSAARNLVDQGVTVDSNPGKPNTKVRTGEVVETPVPAQQTPLEPENVDFGVLYEDDALVVVDKPAGLVVHPGSGRSRETLAGGLLHRYPEVRGVGAANRWGLVHRLDKDTSGALVVARNQAAFEALVEQLRARAIKRDYLALVNGVLRPPTGTIDAPIGRDPATPMRRAVIRTGKHARTHYRSVTNYNESDVSLVNVSLETGRTHQIRVHFSAIRHPVIGDPLYGSTHDNVDSPRIFLHAAKLAFSHPLSNDAIEVESPLPQDLQQVVESLGDGSAV